MDMVKSHNMDRPAPKTRLRRRLVPWLATATVGLGALAGVGYVISGASLKTVRVPAGTVTIDPVASGVFHDLTPLRGKVAPHDTILLDALEGGQVARILAHGGDRVRAGQPLLVFRNTELELDVLEREGRLIESITQLRSYEKSLEDSRLANEKSANEIAYNIVRLSRAETRRADLVQKGYVPAEQQDQLVDELHLNEKLRPLQSRNNTRQEQLRARQLPEIHLEMASLKKSLTITHGKLDNLTVRAPVDGQLTSLVQNLGENQNRGQRLGEIVPDTGYKVTATVDEYYLGRVHVGQTATVTVDGQTRRLQVDRVYPQVKEGVFTLDLTFVGATPAGLLPGEAVEGSLALGGDHAGLVVPAGAFLERTGGAWAMVVSPDGRTATRRSIKIGRRNQSQVEILSGLQAGERIVTSDYTGYDKIDRIQLQR